MRVCFSSQNVASLQRPANPHTNAAISTGVGRTYRYYNASFKGTGPALYSFGDGLSYTLFESTCRCGCVVLFHFIA